MADEKLEALAKEAAGHHLAEVTLGVMPRTDGEFVAEEGVAGHQAVRLDFEYGPSIVISGHGDDLDEWINIRKVPRFQ